MATRVYGISLVKNEADIIRPILEHMLTQVDHIIVADNGSTDGTREILKSLPIQVIDDPEVGYWQSDKMTRLADKARKQGADWVVPFDADELWLMRSRRRIADGLNALPESLAVVAADLWDHVSTGIDPDEPNPLKRIEWRRDTPVHLPKVACRTQAGMRIEQGNHSVTYPRNHFLGTVNNLLTVRHFPYRSVEQFIRKVRQGAAAYKATNLPESMGAHWRQWGSILESQGEEAVAEIYRRYFWRLNPTIPLEINGEHQNPLVYDPVTC